MNRPPVLGTYTGTVVHGDGRGKSLGFPTANLDTVVEASAHGVYAGRVRVGGHGPWRPATISIGDNPTFVDAGARRIECHLHDCDEDLYGVTLDVELVAFIRPMDVFRDVGDLVRQTAKDVAASRRILAAAR